MGALAQHILADHLHRMVDDHGRQGPIRGLVPAARLIDPAAATLAAVERAWGLLGHVRSDMFLTTGDPEAMRAAAAAAFGVALPAVQRVGL